jgi:predicted nucleic acid-binding protein
MKIIVTDFSCLSNLHRVNLLKDLSKLPYEFVVSDLIMSEQESLDLDNIKNIIKAKFIISSLPGEDILELQKIRKKHPHVSLSDCSSLLISTKRSDCILMTDNAKLSELALKFDVSVYGTLWGIDEMYGNKIITKIQTYNALLFFKRSSINLSEIELGQKLNKYQ